MTTFSQLVDEVIAETKRPDLAAEIHTYVNQTIREMHFRPDTNAAILYPDNRVETQLVANLDTNYSWEIPNIATFQKLETVQYPSVYGIEIDNNFSREVSPGRNMYNFDRRHYRSQNYYVFYGYGGLNSIINLTYFAFPPRLKYQTVPLRVAQYDDIDGWTYAPAITTDEQKETARAQTSNWILLRWHDVVLEGVRAKIYKRVSDDSRARTCYSLYAQLRNGVFTSEIGALSQ